MGSTERHAGTDTPAGRAELSPIPFAWLGTALPRNDDFGRRVVEIDDDDAWQPTGIDGLDVRWLERVGGPADARVAVLLRQRDPDHPVPLPVEPGSEYFLLAGEAVLDDRGWHAGLYLREPPRAAATPDRPPVALSLAASSRDGAAATRRAVMYVAHGHLRATDGEQRIINSRDEAHWLPGPVDGTQVLPIHGHGTANVMLVRWYAEVAFQPRLDPLGEEVLVLEGSLSDAEGRYPAGSWIRNPVPAWQSWSAAPGTVVLYKSGHFATPVDPDAMDTLAASR